MTHDIFLSYKREDKPLDAAGIRIYD